MLDNLCMFSAQAGLHSGANLIAPVCLIFLLFGSKLPTDRLHCSFFIAHPGLVADCVRQLSFPHRTPEFEVGLMTAAPSYLWL